VNVVPAGVIAVVRAATAGECRAIVRGLILAGVPAIELTLTVPDAVALIREFAAELAGAGPSPGARPDAGPDAGPGPGPDPGPGPGKGTVLGAGTVLDAAQCAAVAEAGATFIVSPVTDAAVLSESRRHGAGYVGGALTPTEVLASMRAGADAVKLFPVGSVGGASYLRALREPLPELRAVVSGGISAGEAPGYFAAGAHAVCLGGALIDRDAARRGDVPAVAAKARLVLGQIAAGVSERACE
jgi:2-dehydro-3-deoxyphosphogluconate aldolase/(4S)-4-hydroxy-2-oxoglutarate aldolase